MSYSISHTGNNSFESEDNSLSETDKDILGLLLKHGADANEQNYEGYSALHLISLENPAFFCPVIKLLWEAGANLYALNHRGQTFLQVMANKGLTPYVEQYCNHVPTLSWQALKVVQKTAKLSGENNQLLRERFTNMPPLFKELYFKEFIEIDENQSSMLKDWFKKRKDVEKVKSRNNLDNYHDTTYETYRYHLMDNEPSYDSEYEGYSNEQWFRDYDDLRDGD